MKATPILGVLLIAASAIVLGGCVAAVGAGAAAGAVTALDRRSAGTLLDDQVIELKIMGALLGDTELSKQAHINTTSYNHMVLLSGEVPDEQLRERAGEIARKHPKVRGIYNELTLAAPSSLLTRSSDSVITGKVKSTLIADKQLHAVRVKVVTENGTVFLLGLVTQAEAKRATEIARRIGGVQRVVKLFEYIN